MKRNGFKLLSLVGLVLAILLSGAAAHAACKYGDVNCDGELDVADVQCILQAALAGLSGQEWPECLYQNGNQDEGGWQYADLNCSGNVDISDVYIALNIVLDIPLSQQLDGDGNGIADCKEPQNEEVPACADEYLLWCEACSSISLNWIDLNGESHQKQVFPGDTIPVELAENASLMYLIVEYTEGIFNKPQLKNLTSGQVVSPVKGNKLQNPLAGDDAWYFVHPEMDDVLICTDLDPCNQVYKVWFYCEYGYPNEASSLVLLMSDGTSEEIPVEHGGTFNASSLALAEIAYLKDVIDPPGYVCYPQIFNAVGGKKITPTNAAELQFPGVQGVTYFLKHPESGDITECSPSPTQEACEDFGSKADFCDDGVDQYFDLISLSDVGTCQLDEKQLMVCTSKGCGDNGCLSQMNSGFIYTSNGLQGDPRYDLMWEVDGNENWVYGNESFQMDSLTFCSASEIRFRLYNESGPLEELDVSILTNFAQTLDVSNVDEFGWIILKSESKVVSQPLMDDVCDWLLSI